MGGGENILSIWNSCKNTPFFSFPNYMSLWGWIFFIYFNQNNLQQQTECRSKRENPATATCCVLLNVLSTNAVVEATGLKRLLQETVCCEDGGGERRNRWWDPGGHWRLRGSEEEETQKGRHRKCQMSRGWSAGGKLQSGRQEVTLSPGSKDSTSWPPNKRCTRCLWISFHHIGYKMQSAVCNLEEGSHQGQPWWPSG